ncbi:MAG: TRAP transporter large permease subunit [Albidovulum sp.]|nr:TRAP transporter large permease subunit [Albidovulum sp.]
MLGTFKEIVPVFQLTVPIFAALAPSLNLDILRRYAVFAAFAGIGMNTPPVCVGVYAQAGVARENPEKAFREMPSFVVVEIIFGLPMIAFLPAATWLPNIAN